ncbi:MAG TPA: endonuclease/exonuclease/phosphatase family protein [candidate division Zixibacteria bacterium]|nr:endonuclease/exonuclease/phosphatase family protein [candidate division Zixibacteria bacterium]
MPSITDPPPKFVRDDLTRLKAQLGDVPSKRDDNLLIATWNIRAFGDLTEKWITGANDSPKRNLHAVRCIAEILSRFDVIALQEVRGNIKAFRHCLKQLGPTWGFLMTDVTRGDQGNDERMAFLYDSARVKPSGLAAELVVPEVVEKKAVSGVNVFQHQFARTPYACSFVRKSSTFILITLHVYYGAKDTPEDRIPELEAIAEWLADWARKLKGYGKEGHGHNLLALGDFNIDRVGDELYDAFTSTGLFTPEDLDLAPRTITSNPLQPEKNHHYDQIAWFNAASGVPHLSLEYRRAGFVNFTNAVMQQMDNTALSWRMSDHFPLWVEFKV